MTYSPLLVRRLTDLAYRISRYDSNFVLEFEDAAQVVVPDLGDEDIPIGMQTAVIAIRDDVHIDPEGPVKVVGSTSLVVKPFHVAVMTKVADKFWLVSMNVDAKQS